MIPSVISFYIAVIMLLGSALGIIFAPRMFLALISFILMIVVSSVLLFDLNSSYIAIFQLILCGIFLSGYIFILLKNIGRLNLKNKLVPVLKMFSGLIVIVSLGFFVYLFFSEDFSNALDKIFVYSVEKSTEPLNFSHHLFPLHLVLLLVLVSAVVIRIFLLSSQHSALSSDGNKSDIVEEEGEV